MPLKQEYFYEEEVKTSPEPYKNEEQEKRKKKKIKNKRKKSAVLGILSFGVALAIVYRYVMISNINMETIKLKKELEQINTANAQLMLATERSMDLREIEKYAKENIGLQKPQNYQIEYITVNKQDITNNQQTNEHKNWIETVIFNIIEFFN